jgi:hypothetical protein
MKEESITDALLREFLLGRLDDDMLERIENLFLTDAQTREKVLAIEQDLIEDYLEDSLSEEDKARFVSRYAQTEEQQRKLRITKSIKDWALTESKADHGEVATVSIWSRLWIQLRLKPVITVPIAVTVVIAIVFAIVWLNSQRERRKYLDIEQELAQLNSPVSLREIPPQIISYDLKPVTVRSVEPQTEVSPGRDIHIVEFTLPWIQDRYPTYEAEVRRFDEDQSFTIRNLRAESNDRHVIRVRLFTRILRPGRYLIHLWGIANDGAHSSAEEYSFTVNR